MKTNYGVVAIAAAILIVGALWLGMPLSTLILLAIVLVCPIMMMVRMKGMHGDGAGGTSTSKATRMTRRPGTEAAAWDTAVDEIRAGVKFEHWCTTYWEDPPDVHILRTIDATRPTIAIE